MLVVMDVLSHTEVVAQIDSFLDRHDMKPSRFGRDALGEPQFVGEVRAGRKPGLATLGKLSEFMRAQDEKLEAAMAPTSTAAAPRPHRLIAGGR